MAESMDPAWMRVAAERYLEILRMVEEKPMLVVHEQPPTGLPAEIRRIIRQEIDLAGNRSLIGCPFATSESPEMARFMTLPGQRQDSLEFLRTFCKGAGDILICDPYALAGEEEAAGQLVEELARVLGLNKKKHRKPKEVTIIHDPRHLTKKVRDRIKQVAGEAQVNLRILRSRRVHDRVWVADGERALLVGNSYGGLGATKGSFIVQLPNDDLVAFKAFLAGEGLL